MKLFDDRFTGIISPHRVYALCKLVEYESMTKEELMNYLEPVGLNAKQEKFKDVFSFADGDLVFQNADGKVISKLTDKELESHEAFRSAIARRVFCRDDLMFTRFTCWYIARGERVYSESADDLAVAFDKELNLKDVMNKYNATNIRAWRPWACYLGFGFIHSGKVIPNVFIRLEDCIKNDSKLTRNKQMQFKKFMDWLVRTCPELDGGEIFTKNVGHAEVEKQKLSVGLSVGLRTLHDRKVIRLEYVKDATDVWHMNGAESHEIADRVSAITVLR